MEMNDQSLFGRIHTLAVGVLEDNLSAAERQELEQLLLTNPAARQAYLAHVQESACLRWLCVEELAERFGRAVEPATSARAGSRGRVATVLAGILAAILVAVVCAPFVNRGGGGAGGAQQVAAQAKSSIPNVAPAKPAGEETNALKRQIVATVTGLSGVKWDSQGSGAKKLLSQCAVGDRLKLRDGSAELTFDAGVQMTVFGPADFEITSPTSIRCVKGRVTTLVDKRGRGFTIETPRAKVVDLGTQFGLAISDSGETEVVVFQGMVDLSYSPAEAAGDGSKRRLQQGEALLVKNSGEFERVVAVQRNSFMESAERKGKRGHEPAIADVHDNIRNAESGAKTYQIVHGGLEDDAPAFVDRGHEWNGLNGEGMSDFLAGADYIMPFNGDKFVGDLELKVDLLRPATLYVFLDNNMEVPDWLRESFTDTGVDIGLDCSKTKWHTDHSLGIGAGKSIDFVFSVWKCKVKQAGEVTLGGLKPPADRTQGFNMYGIAAVADE